MAARKPERVKSDDEIRDEREYARRRNLSAHVEVRHLGGGSRSFGSVISYRGTELGSRTEFTTRGKVTQVLYVLPAIDEVKLGIKRVAHCAQGVCAGVVPEGEHDSSCVAQS